MLLRKIALSYPRPFCVDATVESSCGCSTHAPSKVKKDWFKWCVGLLRPLGLAGEFHCPSLQVGDKIADIATSLGAVVILAWIVDVGRNEAVVDTCWGVLKQSFCRALLVVPVGTAIAVGENLALRVVGHGRVSGFQELLNALSHATNSVLTQCWETLKAEGKLEDPLHHPSHFLTEILHVLLLLLRRRRAANKKKLAKVTLSQIVNLRVCLLRWAAHWMDKYILECYCTLHDVNAPPPALRAGKRHKVHPEAIWDLMEESVPYNQSSFGGSLCRTSAVGPLGQGR